jgi:hypothetical protein
VPSASRIAHRGLRFAKPKRDRRALRAVEVTLHRVLDALRL